VLFRSYVANLAGFVALFGSALRQSWLKGFLKDFPILGGPFAPQVRGLWNFVFSTNFNATVNSALINLPLLGVGALLGTSEAALFRIAKQLSAAVNKPSRMLIPAMYPEMARMRAGKDWRGLRAVSWKVSLACGSVAILMTAVIAVAGGPGMAFVMGPEFRGGATVLVLLTVAAAIGIWALPLEPLLISIDKAGTVLALRMGVTAACLPLYYFFTIGWGLTGTGIAAIVTAVLLHGSQLVPVLRWFRKRENREAKAESSAVSPSPPG
jgi:O-antigen/teichoic acid export membrane protein